MKSMYARVELNTWRRHRDVTAMNQTGDVKFTRSVFYAIDVENSL